MLSLVMVSSLCDFSVQAKTSDSKENKSQYTKKELKELSEAFTQENVQNAINKIDYENNDIQIIPLSENYYLSCKVTSERSTDKNLLSNNLYSINSYAYSSYSTVTHRVYVDANNGLGFKLWSLELAGTFGYDYSSAWVIDTNLSPNVYGWTWQYSNASSKGVNVSSNEAKAVGTAKFYSILDGIPGQSYTAVIAVGCNSSGGIIKYGR